MSDAAHADGSVRLSKRLMELHGCSRSLAEQYIEGGWVQVDGVVVETPGARVQPAQQVTLAAEASPLALSPVTLLVHKPSGTTIAQLLAQLAHEHHWDGDATAPRLLTRHLRQQECVAPLPPKASGLVVLTQDRRIARKLHEDAQVLEQECIAEVEGTLSEAGLKTLCHGLTLDGWVLPPIKVSRQSEQRLRFALKGIPPEAIQAMCHAVGLRLVGLHRLRIGRVALAKLPAGQWRYLAGWERF